MYLTHLSLTNFRSFSRLDMDIPRQILLLVGANAQGKTSLLEAIYYLAAFTSFHAQNDRQLVNFIAGREELAVGRLIAQYQRGTTQHKMEIRLIQEQNGQGGTRLKKEIILDGVNRKIHEALGHFNAVIFLPQMTRILEGSPEERRRYLNLMICQAKPVYTRALSEYHQVLVQRNALLKTLMERKGDASQLDYWDDLLAQKGAVIIEQRISAIREIEKLAAVIHSRLTNSQEILRLVYDPSLDPLAKNDNQMVLPLQVSTERGHLTYEEIKQAFMQKMQQSRSEEIMRGLTLRGPHRDDIHFLANGIDLEHYGSRGQIRTTLLALKMAEVAWLKEKTGHSPVLLLDEILAELDLQRRADLLEVLDGVEQALLTTTDLHLFSETFVSAQTVWKVNEGRVELENYSA